MNNLRVKNNIIKGSILGATILLVVSNQANAASFSGGSLTLNLDHQIFQSENKAPAADGTTITSFIEHYYDAATANSLKGFELVRNNRDEADSYFPVTSTQNLVFDMNGATVSHPLTPNPNLPGAAQHYLQKTDFEFDPAVGLHNSATGQIGFGGTMRVGFGNLDFVAPATSPEYDPTLGVIGIGDFTMMHDATDGWVFNSTTGTGGGGFTNPSAPEGVRVFNTENLSMDRSVAGELTISGDLLWTTFLAANGFQFFDNGVFNAGTFSMTATISSGSVSAVPAPAAVWLFGSGLVGLIGYGRSKKNV